MRIEDFKFAAELANTLNWNMAIEDFQFAVSLEPHGCFVAFEGSERVGIATCINYGRVGWFGNLIVNEKCRRQGVGSLLVKHAINYLQCKGVKAVGLYAYQNLLSFYSKLGFKFERGYCVLQAERLGSISADNCPNVGRDQICKVEEFDCRCFGGDRRRLLESIILESDNLSYYKLANNEFVGYIAATVYEKMAWVGPLLCKTGNSNAAVSLLKAILSKLTGKSVYIAIPKDESVLSNLLFESGFVEDFAVSSMFFGEVVTKNCIYVAESLERG